MVSTGSIVFASDWHLQVESSKNQIKERLKNNNDDDRYAKVVLRKRLIDLKNLEHNSLKKIEEKQNQAALNRYGRNLANSSARRYNSVIDDLLSEIGWLSADSLELNETGWLIAISLEKKQAYCFTPTITPAAFSTTSVGLPKVLPTSSTSDSTSCDHKKVIRQSTTRPFLEKNI